MAAKFVGIIYPKIVDILSLITPKKEKRKIKNGGSRYFVEKSRASSLIN